MYRKTGKYRSFSDNINLASCLASTAGMVNAAGLMAFFVVTTNVTGHMAILSEEFIRSNWQQIFILVFYLTMFFLGSFTSSFLSIILKKRPSKPYNHLIVLFEVVLLLGVGIYGLFFYSGISGEAELLSAVLLFAMGLQNALVSNISNAVVRTTHLTGLFTDLGIDIAAYCLVQNDKRNLLKRMKLRFIIVFFYFAGGVFGGLVYLQIGFGMFFLAAAVLVYTVIYSKIKYGFIKAKRKFYRFRNYPFFSDTIKPKTS